MPSVASRATRGRLIVVDGLDGVGKTTVSQRLAGRLGARWMATPSNALRAGGLTRDAYQSNEGLVLFYASAVVDAGATIRACLARGEDVVCDRYWLSTISGAAARGVRLPLGVLEQLVEPADYTFVLTAPTATRAARLRGRGKFTRGDAASLDPRWASTVRSVMRAELRSRVSGVGCEVGTGHVTAEDVVATIEARLAMRAPHLGRPMSLLPEGAARSPAPLL